MVDIGTSIGLCRSHCQSLETGHFTFRNYTFLPLSKYVSGPGWLILVIGLYELLGNPTT
jgi:hypothetical protein